MHNKATRMHRGKAVAETFGQSVSSIYRAIEVGERDIPCGVLTEVPA